MVRDGSGADNSAGMGYQPALDGLRALSVALVILYHAGAAFASDLAEGSVPPWFFDGGFLGVEVFFVVSGFLITTLLLEERERTGGVSLRQFWLRRFRRLMPALWVMVAVAALWAVLWGRRFIADLRSDAVFGLAYAANFHQLFDKASYFGSEPHLLRHLWSLAVEEHFYLVFPLVFGLVVRRRSRSRRRLFVGSSLLALASMVALVAVWSRPVERLGEAGVALDDVRQNWAYLSSFTRVGGILVGVSLALVWSPWRRPGSVSRSLRAWLDTAGVVAVVGVVVLSLVLSSDSAWLYRGGLSLVSVLSAVAIAAAVAPGSRLMRAVFGNRVLAGLGRRSYGLYLWHWPVFVGPLAGRATWVRLVVGVPVTLVLSELCLRWVEDPVRRGVLGSWVRRGRWLPVTGVVVGLAGVASALFMVDSRDVAADDESVEAVEGVPETGLSDAGVVMAVPETDRPGSSVLPVASGPAAPSTSSSPSTAPVTAPPSVTTTLPLLPRRVLVVGDSQGLSFMHHMPTAARRGILFSRGALSGCGVLDEGVIVSESNYDDDFSRCGGWQERWASAARRTVAEVTVVMLGAWDVFGLELDGREVEFGSPEYDTRWKTAVQSGIDALVAAGSRVALLEIPCFRPTRTGNKMRLFPERGFDARTRRLDGLLREIALANPLHVTYVDGPDAWCAEDPIATDRRYRYDGVHVTARGARYLADWITPALLEIPVDAARHPVPG